MTVKEISALEVRHNLGEILEQAHYLGQEFVVERAGKPMAVIVPLQHYRRYRREPKRDFDVLDQIHARLDRIDSPQAELDALATTMALRHGKKA